MTTMLIMLFSLHLVGCRSLKTSGSFLVIFKALTVFLWSSTFNNIELVLSEVPRSGTSCTVEQRLKWRWNCIASG